MDEGKIDKIREVYDEIFELLKKNEIIHIFTTNYDRAIEEYVINNEKMILNDGFIQ